MMLVILKGIGCVRACEVNYRGYYEVRFVIEEVLLRPKAEKDKKNKKEK
jgi:hypothetical protein